MSTYSHVPVMAHRVVELLSFDGAGWICDGTIGLGGHAALLLEASPDAKYLGLDRDPEALAIARKNLERFSDRVILEHSNFSELGEAMKAHNIESAKSILLDLGLSSFQLENGARGFSFDRSGPLDMRADPTRGKTLAEILSRIGEKELADAIWEFGDERESRRIAPRILEDFRAGDITDTTTLAKSIARSFRKGRKPNKINPATKTFQALRILVNGELDALEEFLSSAPTLLGIGGRLAVISFHSKEDRIVKKWFRYQSASCVCPKEFPVCRCGNHPHMRLLARGEKPEDSEVSRNPRSRSAILRAGERLL